MPHAQSAFSAICPTLSFSEYCSAPWQVSIEQRCCGVCPSPAINAYGTIIGLIIASFFNLLIVLFEPAQAAIYICAQLMLGNMYVIAIMVRNWMGRLSQGTNGIQRWHCEFAFLLAASSSSLILACLLSDVHHIHGFDRKGQLHEFQAKNAVRKRHRTLKNTGTSSLPSHALFPQPHDTKLQRLRKFFGRRQAAILFFTFLTTEIYWFVVYAFIWWGKDGIFWQSNCDEIIGPSNFSLLAGVSIVFSSIAIVSSLFFVLPVFFSLSASEFIVRLFHATKRTPFHSDSRLRLRLKVQNHIKRGKISNPPIDLIHTETKTEKWVKVGISLAVWIFWFVSVLVILLRALDEFLLVGTAWPYAGMQNLIFGCFPAVRFFISPFQRHLRGRRTTSRAKTSSVSARAHSAPDSPHPDARQRLLPAPTSRDSHASSRARLDEPLSAEASEDVERSLFVSRRSHQGLTSSNPNLPSSFRSGRRMERS